MKNSKLEVENIDEEMKLDRVCRVRLYIGEGQFVKTHSLAVAERLRGPDGSVFEVDATLRQDLEEFRDCHFHDAVAGSFNCYIFHSAHAACDRELFYTLLERSFEWGSLERFVIIMNAEKIENVNIRWLARSYHPEIFGNRIVTHN